LITIKSKTGYDKIYSKRLNKHIYFIKHRAVIVPDSNATKYIPQEVALIGDVDDEELRLIDNAKDIFKGMLIK
jgi:hypothetical protein